MRSRMLARDCSNWVRRQKLFGGVLLRDSLDAPPRSSGDAMIDPRFAADILIVPAPTPYQRRRARRIRIIVCAIGAAILFAAMWFAFTAIVGQVG